MSGGKLRPALGQGVNRTLRRRTRDVGEVIAIHSAMMEDSDVYGNLTTPSQASISFRAASMIFSISISDPASRSASAVASRPANAS